MGSFDIDSLFTNITLEDTTEILQIIFFKESVEGLHKSK